MPAAVLANNTFTELAVYIGCSMMAFLYAQAISYRMNMDRKLREDAQRQLTEELEQALKFSPVERIIQIDNH